MAFHVEASWFEKANERAVAILKWFRYNNALQSLQMFYYLAELRRRIFLSAAIARAVIDDMELTLQ